MTSTDMEEREERERERKNIERTKNCTVPGPETTIEPCIPTNQPKIKDQVNREDRMQTAFKGLCISVLDGMACDM